MSNQITRENHKRQIRQRGRFVPQFHRLKIERNEDHVVTVFPRRVSLATADSLVRRVSVILPDPDRIGLRVAPSAQYPGNVAILGTGLTDAERVLLRQYLATLY